MQTLYIDVYFLINFTVDLLALYFSYFISGISLKRIPLLLSSLLGGITPCIGLMLGEDHIIKLIYMMLSMVLITCIATVGVGVIRKIRFGISFLILISLIGTLVGFLWEILDHFLCELLIDSAADAVNRKMLMLSTGLLICIGVIKMMLSFFVDGASVNSVRVKIDFLDKSVELDALVDSGNLAVDPMDMQPVMLLKRKDAEMIFPKAVTELGDPDCLDRNVRKRIRLIPVSRGGSTHVLVGIRPDSVSLAKKEGYEQLTLTVAIDREGGTYGGYGALMPYSGIKNVL